MARDAGHFYFLLIFSSQDGKNSYHSTQRRESHESKYFSKKIGDRSIVSYPFGYGMAWVFDHNKGKTGGTRKSRRKGDEYI